MSEVSLIAILVIEDSPTFAKVIEAMLQRHSGQPTRVEVAHTLNAGLQKLMSMRFDLVLLDLSLPDSEGLAALQSVQRENPSVPIIILSGIEDEALALTALNAGAQDYLLKGETNARTLNRAVAYGIARSTLRGLEAERLRLFEQREDFMATLTHDLKNPLIGANRILELMIDQQLGTLPEQHIRLLSKLRDSNIALLGMIRNLIEVYRYEKDVQTMVCEATDFSALISSFLEEVQPLVDDRRITLQRHLVANTENFHADRQSLGRVVQNLIQNAIKFTPEGGSILVRLWDDGRKIHFQVQDSGPGISDEDKSKLFQRFWQGHAGKIYSDGTGLGLYLCRQIVEAHQGQICYSREPNFGSTFTVTLPLMTLLEGNN